MDSITFTERKYAPLDIVTLMERIRCAADCRPDVLFAATRDGWPIVDVVGMNGAEYVVAVMQVTDAS
jgi:hypothetical protein